MDPVQIRTDTLIFRDTIPFRVARAAIDKEEAELSILSFGCARGDEPATLKALFPKAKVAGCDINDYALALAKNIAGPIDIFRSTWPSIKERGPYDLICACSSLCLNPVPKEGLNEQFPFTKFDDYLSSLAENLNPGGTMVIYNSSYFFRHSSCASEFKPISSPQLFSSGFVSRGLPDGRLALTLQGASGTDMYLKVHYTDGIIDDDLVNCVFKKGPSQTVDLSRSIGTEWTPVLAWDRSVLQGVSAVERAKAIDVIWSTCLYRNENADLGVELRVKRKHLHDDGWFESGPRFYPEGVGFVPLG
jgi:hypothetical protein